MLDFTDKVGWGLLEKYLILLDFLKIDYRQCEEKLLRYLSCLQETPGLNPGSGRLLWRRDRLPTSIFLPGNSMDRVSYSPQGPKELDTTEWLSTAMWRKSERLIWNEECSFYKRVKFVIEASFKWQRMWYEKKGDKEMSKLSLWNNLWAGIFPKDHKYVHIIIMSN